jgi:hypothetical protein
MRTKIYILGLACLLLISCGPDFKAKPPTAPLVSQGPNIVSFTANPATIKLGEKSTLSWEVHDCTSVEIDVGIGKVKPTDSIEVNPSKTTTYTLQANKTEYNSETGVYVSYGWITKTCTVTVEK